MREAQEEAIELVQKSRDNRTPWHPCAVLPCVLVPTVVFAVAIFSRCSSLRCHSGGLAFFFTLVCFVVCVVASMSARSRKLRGSRSRVRLSVATCLWVALVIAVVVGDQLYNTRLKGYCTLQGMNSYINIDPNNDRGQSYMDSGRVYFKENSYVVTNKALAYQSLHTYCVAPILRESVENQGSGGDQITLSTPDSGTVDWWAVGIDCCDEDGGNFNCYDAAKTTARSGVRELRTDARSFFVLATQQWASWMQVPVKHALFFHWVEDPLAIMDGDRTSAETYRFWSIFMWIPVNIAVALVALWSLAKLHIK